MATYQDTVVKDFDKAIDHTKETGDWLRKLFYDASISTLLNQSRINVLITGADFLLSNLRELRLLYQTKAER